MGKSVLWNEASVCEERCVMGTWVTTAVEVIQGWLGQLTATRVTLGIECAHRGSECPQTSLWLLPDPKGRSGTGHGSCQQASGHCPEQHPLGSHPLADVNPAKDAGFSWTLAQEMSP